jgi:hypothetical protein
MYCPKCGDALQESQGSFKCLRGDMELSRYIADRLYACFVAKSEEPEEAKLAYKVGGRWFCPGFGIAMKEEIAGTVRCSQCRRNIGNFIPQLVEFHPHS